MQSRVRPLFFILSAFFSLIRSGESAVTVVMDNGDSITGEFVSFEDSSLKLKVDYLGEVVLPKGRISNFEKIQAAIQAEADTELEESESASSVASPNTKPKTFFERIPFHDWDKSIQLGMTAQSGRRDKEDIYYRFDMGRKGEKQQIRFTAKYDYGKTAEVKTAAKMAANMRWRRDIAPGVFYESNSSYLSDEIKLIDLNLEQELGLGTRFIDNDKMTLSSGLGASGRWREFENMEEEVAYLVSLFQDWDYQINNRLHLKQDMRFAMPLEENDDYEYEFAASLISAFSEAINLSLRYELGFDNSLDEELREDRRFISSLGYSF